MSQPCALALNLHRICTNMNQNYWESLANWESPWKGCRFATIIEDYGKELLVQVSSGAEVTVLRDEVFIL